ncbi:MAG: hypothetical protein IJB39_03350 [Alistipes sp.]|nr:hypothetical protein [Alistipes sp.]
MSFVKNIMGAALVAVALVLGACVDSEEIPFEEAEKVSMEAWMQANHPELMDNYQERGGYYVDVLDAGVADSLPVRNLDSWVWLKITCRDLRGNVVLTRDSDQAQMQGTYTSYTHYAPYFLYCGKDNTSMPEGTYMSLRNKLKIGDDTEFQARYGTKMRLYLPSSVGTKDQSMGGDGGYEGQFVLDANRPMIVDVEVCGHLTNPLAYEDAWVQSFAKANGDLAPKEDKKEEQTSKLYRATRAEGDEEQKEEIVYDEKWHLAVDSIAGLYVNYLYTPKKSLEFNCLADTTLFAGQTEYRHGKLYGVKTLAQINQEVDAALIKRFGEGLHPSEAEAIDSVATAKIWYVTRLLDGFIVDTNIPEVKEILHEDYIAEDKGTALDFVTGEDNAGDNSYVDAWKYAVPQLKLGAWNAILTTSSNAYGATGVSGTRKTSSSSNNYYDYYNYYNYYNSYYGNGYYNNYYNNYYGGYGGYGGYYGGYGYYPNYYNSMYYNNFYNNSYTTDTTESETVTTEIQPYSPLLFQVFIEKRK